MDTMLDLQLFAEETETEDTQPTEEVQEQPEEKAEPEAIPQELDGLPEEAAREAMEEMKQQEPPETPAETDNSENKPSEGSAVKDIPYPRFKEVVDKKNAMQAELEAYRARFGELGANPQPQQPAQQPVQQPVQTMAQEPPAQTSGLGGMRFTPEVSEKIEEAVKQQALQMTGMTAEDLTSLEEYGDDDDPKLKMLENAKGIARNYIMGEITEAMRQQQAQRTAFLQQHQNMVADYNAFVQKEFAEPDFKDVQEFAIGAYFEQLPAIDQAALREAYARTERQVASPQDIMLVKRYFADAKAAFHSRNAKAPAPQKPKPSKPSLPRAAEVDGSAATPSQGITNESLAKMLDETDDPRQLPENIRRLLMG